ncbi:response regulator transcription factor [Raineyella sp. LH-20]|uniref:response regulator transcription factor n=1 Tax=Raineyella sp. LH-20 TaxID=3081204 RepID=UPI00295337E5|nr:response regulator transcription factor [Raineyella sp. LH-20]WOP17704.1 response regulator transcription factor [Raineyella sp. LH-20]
MHAHWSTSVSPSLRRTVLVTPAVITIGAMRLLVIEDERTLADGVRKVLRREGHAVTVAYDGPSGESLALTGNFALVLLDLMLPGKSGLEVLGTVRQRLPTLPVIVLTARGTVAQKVEGLDRGASDYVTKPFSLEELLARVRAQLRGPNQPVSSALDDAGIHLDLRTRRVQRYGHDVHLTTREFNLLAFLMRHPDQVLSRKQILNAVWGLDFDPGTKVLEVYIGYLRRKLCVDNGGPLGEWTSRGGDPSPIETVRSVGYRLSTRHA